MADRVAWMALLVGVASAGAVSCRMGVEPLPEPDRDPTVDPPPGDPPPLDGDACEPHRATLDALVGDLERERAALEIPGVGLAVVIDDCLFARGLGVEREGGVAVDEHTRFQLASLTKTLTALTALALEEEEILDRTMPVSHWAPTTSTASLESLLAHRAGFPTDLADSYSLDLEEFIEGNASVPMWAPPNAVWLYSNPGFALAGRALEVAAGEPFAALVRSRVFEPAGMADAIMGAELVGGEARMASGHSGSPGQAELIEPTDLYLASTYYGPMGGAFASAADLARLMRAFMTEEVLTTSSLDDMTRSRGAAYGTAVGYGQGLFTLYDGTAYHGGSVAGFLCEMDVHREARVGVAVLSAADWAFPTDTLYDALAQLLPPPGPPPPDAGPTAAEIVGTYDDDVVLGTVEVASTADGMTITIAGATHELTAWGDGAWGFWWPEWQTEIEASFQRAPTGELYLVTLLGVAARR